LSRIGIDSVRLVGGTKANNSAWKLKKQIETNYMCMNLQSKPNWFVAAKRRSVFSQTNKSILCKISAVFVAVEIFTTAK